MPIPNLIHPVPITIQQIDITETLFDEDYREPIQQSKRKTNIIVDGQIKWGMDDDLKMSRGGAQEKSDGYVLFRYVDLESASIVLRQNDRFIKLGTLEVDVYIIKLKPMGHYQDAGGPTIVKAYFLDRQPSRQGLTT